MCKGPGEFAELATALDTYASPPSDSPDLPASSHSAASGPRASLAAGPQIFVGSQCARAADRGAETFETQDKGRSDAVKA